MTIPKEAVETAAKAIEKRRAEAVDGCFRPSGTDCDPRDCYCRRESLLDAKAALTAALPLLVECRVCAEILSIMRTYDEQMEKSGYVDTPGGLEHMGDVWRLFENWRCELTPPPSSSGDAE